jgi:hypothetical protein
MMLPKNIWKLERVEGRIILDTISGSMIITALSCEDFEGFPGMEVAYKYYR